MTDITPLDIAQLNPSVIGYRLEVEDENGYRVGIRLARYEVITERDGKLLYILYSDPAPVAVKARPGAKLYVVATVSGTASAPAAMPAGPATASRPGFLPAPGQTAASAPVQAPATPPSAPRGPA